jgi:hypothetical protein
MKNKNPESPIFIHETIRKTGSFNKKILAVEISSDSSLKEPEIVQTKKKRKEIQQCSSSEIIQVEHKQKKRPSRKKRSQEAILALSEPQIVHSTQISERESAEIHINNRESIFEKMQREQQDLEFAERIQQQEYEQFSVIQNRFNIGRVYNMMRGSDFNPSAIYGNSFEFIPPEIFEEDQAILNRAFTNYVADESFDDSYETLLALGERIGSVKSKGLSAAIISQLPTRKFKRSVNCNENSYFFC